MKYGEAFESTLVDRFSGKKYIHPAVYKYVACGEYHTDKFGDGLWDGDKQIVGTCDFTVVGCRTEAAAKAKVRAYVNKYVKEDEEEMQEKTMWYAVQEERTDAWDFGSHDYEEAVRMLKEQGHGLIAVIDEKDGFCVKEIEYADAVNED